MANKYIKEVEGGKVTTLSDTDAFELDTGTESNYIEASDLATEILKRTDDLTEDETPTLSETYLPAVDGDGNPVKVRADNIGSGGSSNGWVDGTGTWSYVSADSPSFVCNVPDADAALFSVGTRFSLTQTTEKFFIVTAKGSPSGGYTPCTIYGGTDYTLANAAITSPKWSNVKAPLNFPLDPTKWTVIVTDTSGRTQASPTADVWYNLGTTNSQISIPIGAWDVSYKVAPYAVKSSATINVSFCTLSTANNSESDSEWTGYVYNQGASANLVTAATVFVSKPLVLAAKATYYLNAKTSQSSVTTLGFDNVSAKMFIRAKCAYL